jgi:ketosteroid isomerase-like protein
MNLRNASVGWAMCAVMLVSTWAAAQTPNNLKAAADQILKSDAAFAQSVANKNREKFLSFIADVTTFNGGTATELHGRDAVLKAWSDFFRARRSHPVMDPPEWGGHRSR